MLACRLLRKVWLAGVKACLSAMKNNSKRHLLNVLPVVCSTNESTLLYVYKKTYSFDWNLPLNILFIALGRMLWQGPLTKLYGRANETMFPMPEDEKSDWKLVCST